MGTGTENGQFVHKIMMEVGVYFTKETQSKILL